MKLADIKEGRVYGWCPPRAVHAAPDPVYPVEITTVHAASVVIEILGDPRCSYTDEACIGSHRRGERLGVEVRGISGYWFGVEHTVEQWRQFQRDGGAADQARLAEAERVRARQRHDEFAAFAMASGASPVAMLLGD